jgi:hypothetical protein
VRSPYDVKTAGAHNVDIATEKSRGGEQLLQVELTGLRFGWFVLSDEHPEGEDLTLIEYDARVVAELIRRLQLHALRRSMFYDLQHPRI